MSINKVILIGRLGKDPEQKFLPSGVSVCEFSLATSESWNDKSGAKQEKTEWHNVKVWGKVGENCALYLRKGSSCYVEGSIETRTWDNDKGEKQYRTEISARSVKFLDSKKVDSDNLTQDDIPF